MSNEPSKVNSTMNSTMGYVKESVGSVIGNSEMQANGAAQRAKGDAEYKAAQAAGYTEGAKDSMTGSVKDTVGGVIGNEQMQAEGKASKASGDVKKAANS